MTADDSESDQSSRGSTPPSSRARRNGTKESSSKSRHKTELTKIIQVGNIAPQATREQMHTLFGYVGKIDDLRLYPTVDLGMHTSKICFVKFHDGADVGTALHLTNTVFIDRAIIIIPYMDGEIPDEQKALEVLSSGTLLPGIADPKLPQHVTSQIEGVHPNQVVVTVDPKLIENNLPAYPPLSPNHDTRRIEEIRRTVLVANLDPELSAEDVIDYFNRAGEVKYFRFCTRDNDPLFYTLMEFSEQPSILNALKLNGTKLGSKYIKVYHSTQAIAKPQAKTNEAAQKEIEEAMSRQAQTILSQGLEATTGKDKRRGSSRSRSRSPSRSRRGRRSRSRSHRRSRSRSNRRSKSRSRRRSTSRHRHLYRSSKSKKSRSRTPKKSRSGSREIRSSLKSSKKRERSRSRRKSSSPSPSKRRSRSRSKKREEKKKVKKAKKEKDRSRERTKDKSDRGDKDLLRERDRDTKDRDKEHRSRSDKKKDKERDRGSKRERDHRENGIDLMDFDQD